VLSLRRNPIRESVLPVAVVAQMKQREPAAEAG
jgi:hypothetical protein